MKETIWICVYRDTIERHNASDNLTEVRVTKEFFKQYFNEKQKEYWDSIEDFLTNILLMIQRIFTIMLWNTMQ